MYTYPAREAKNSFSMLLDMAALGHEIRITKHGQEIAKLVSNTAQILQVTKSKMTSKMTKPESRQALTANPDSAILNELASIRARVKSASAAYGASEPLTWQVARDDGRRV
jgi:prevent-host-death family protein